MEKPVCGGHVVVMHVIYFTVVIAKLQKDELAN
jgi:hypothetical protein